MKDGYNYVATYGDHSYAPFRVDIYLKKTNDGSNIGPLGLYGYQVFDKADKVVYEKDNFATESAMNRDIIDFLIQYALSFNAAIQTLNAQGHTYLAEMIQKAVRI